MADTFIPKSTPSNSCFLLVALYTISPIAKAFTGLFWTSPVTPVNLESHFARSVLCRSENVTV